MDISYPEPHFPEGI